MPGTADGAEPILQTRRRDEPEEPHLLSAGVGYFVLQAALADAAPSGLWWMSSFGAGFSCHGALLEVA